MKHLRIKTRLFRRAALSLLTLVMAFTAQTAWADHGWYDGAMTIGGVTTDCTEWSTSGDTPTDLGIVDNMTITSIAFNVWSDANDRGGANMFFRIWDGGSSQVGADQDLHLGAATRIEGKAHDFSISWTGTENLASAVGLTLEHGKTYYIDMYAKTYGTSGDEWYSANSANFHAKLIYAPSGNCGTTDHESDVTWSLNSGGVLTISGSGAMVNYNSYTEIPWFSYRNNITSVVIGEGVTTIGKGAFYSCNNLESVSIPATVTSIGEEAFAECGPSTGMTVAIAEGSALGTIDAKAFLFSNLVSITLPSSLTTISSSAFYYCGKLTSITIPASVTSIGSDAFNHCSSLVSVYVMATTPPTLGNNYAFSNAASGLKIYVPAGYGSTYRGEDGWPAYTSIIEELTASGYCGDPSVNDGKNVVWTLTSGGVLTISGTGAMADYGTTNMPWNSSKSGITSVVIENCVSSIGTLAFCQCVNLTSVSIPASVTSIGESAFTECGTSATALTVTFATGSTLTTIGERAFQKAKLTSITIPAGMTTIDNEAFLECLSLASVSIPASVTTIGYSAFENCSSLSTIDIPTSVTSIGGTAFSGCTNLTTVTLHSNPYIDYDAFPDNATVTMNLTANSAGGAKWMTFYNKNYIFQADENTQVFKVTLSGTKGDELTMHEVGDRIVDANVAVVLKKTSGHPVMTLTTDHSSDKENNHLDGVDDPDGMTVNTGNIYVLNYTDAKGVGFYKLTVGKKLGVGKAYFAYIEPGPGAREFLCFGETTSLSEKLRVKSEEFATAPVYDLQGRRVSQPTKGLYIVNGKKVVIK